MMKAKEWKALKAEAKKTNKKYQAEKERRTTAERTRDTEKLVGKVLRYKNCYSCPEKPSDYWWLYVFVKGVGEYGMVLCDIVEIDRNGRIDIREDERYPHFFHDGYKITTKAALAKVLQRAHERVVEINVTLDTTFST